MIWDIRGKEVTDISGIRVNSIYEIIITSPLDGSKEIVFAIVNSIKFKENFNDNIERVNFTDIYCSKPENKDYDYNWRLIDLSVGFNGYEYEVREVIQAKTIEDQFFEKYPEYKIWQF